MEGTKLDAFWQQKRINSCVCAAQSFLFLQPESGSNFALGKAHLRGAECPQAHFLWKLSGFMLLAGRISCLGKTPKLTVVVECPETSGS